MKQNKIVKHNIWGFFFAINRICRESNWRKEKKVKASETEKGKKSVRLRTKAQEVNEF